MRNTKLVQAAVLAMAVAAPLGAQAANDPTNKVTGSGQLPPGWMLRFDPTRPGRPAPQATDVSFAPMGAGLHVKSGPAAIYYNTKDTPTGEYAVSATFAQSKSMQHEAYGLFIGGKNLQDATQDYLYFVIRPMDGSILINHRAGDARPKQLVAWTPEPAVNKDDPADGKATNQLTIHVAKDTVHFVANGKLVKALAKTQLDGASTDGQVGLRINHNIDLHISNYGVKK
jgi:hypothetical protein